MTSRKQNLEKIFENFQILRRNLIAPRISGVPEAMTVSQWMTLKYIEEEEGTTVKNVARSLNISSSAATQLIDILVRSGYVVRKENKKDRREVTLSISKKAIREVAKMKRHILSQLVTVFKVLNDSEFEKYLILNNKIVSSFNTKK